MKHRLDAEHAVETLVRAWQFTGVGLHERKLRAAARDRGADFELPYVGAETGEPHSGQARQRFEEASEAAPDIENVRAAFDCGGGDDELGQPPLGPFEFARLQRRRERRRIVPKPEMHVAPGDAPAKVLDQEIEIGWRLGGQAQPQQ